MLTGTPALDGAGSSLLIFKLEQAGGADSDRRAWLGSPSKAGTKVRASVLLFLDTSQPSKTNTS